MRVLIFIVLMMSMPVYAENYLQKDMPLLKVKDIVIRHGWKPLVTQHEYVAEGEDGFPYSEIERKLILGGFVEVSSCSLGKELCNFYYRKNGKCILLETEGEVVNEMKLFYWARVKCPGS